MRSLRRRWCRPADDPPHPLTPAVMRGRPSGGPSNAAVAVPKATALLLATQSGSPQGGARRDWLRGRRSGRSGSEADRVANDEAGELAAAAAPAGAVLRQRDRVVAATLDRHPGVAGVGIDAD